MSQSYGYHAGHPGSTDIIETAERAILWHGANGLGHYFRTIAVDATAVDSGNTPTSLLRPGLVMAQLDAGEYVDYDSDATDGSQEAVGILVEELYMLDPATAAAQDRQFRMVVWGGIVSAECINLDLQARAQLCRKGIHFDDGNNPRLPWRRAVNKAADYTVVAGDCGKLFTASAAAVFTLPAAAAGFYAYFKADADANLTVTSAEGDNVVALHDVAADSVAFSTASAMIGGMVMVFGYYSGTTFKWGVTNMSAGANTVTVAT